MTYILILAGFLLVSCVGNTPELVQQDDALYKRCGKPRPQICTREYRPVCGTSNTVTKTYGNACGACSDSKVFSYRSGACDKMTK